MKKLLKVALLATMSVLCIPTTQAADTPVKREMRSAWVATVWRLDWPSTVITSTGNTTQINKQKNELTTLLDSMALNNMNAVNFQVRSRADAMYKSSYEPWSSDLVSTRGLDPGYDPLAYCVDECHKRGLECHAWINPYRFESVQGQWGGLPGDYRTDHPDWVQDVGGAAILEPAHPDVIQRICDIIAEIVTNYDVDGVLFDDYFYLQGVSNQDDAWYNKYTAEGGTLSRGDWRRENVNKMIAAVYKTIKDIKPWVRFGVSPAGIACTTESVANKYGVTKCPVGSDWQYNGIYSDPLAWISRQTLDFISPQIYWTIGSTNDYQYAAKWWSNIAAKWGRHFYSSHSISSLTSSSKSPAMSTAEATLADLPGKDASGPNATTFSEFANEVRLNRQYTQNDAPGSIFYSAKYLYKNAPLFAHYLKTTVFNTPALVPAMPWFPVTSAGVVDGVYTSGTKLTWTGGPDNVRYTVYAVPTSLDKQNFTRQVEYLAGVSYAKTYYIPQRYRSGYNFAVCVLDRYGNEYSPVFAGDIVETLPAPTGLKPTGGESIEMPFDFSWNAVAKASHYIVDISENATMTPLAGTTEVHATTLSSTVFTDMPVNKTLYWQVRACGSAARDGVSEVQSFVPKTLVIDYPSDGAEDISLTPDIRWSVVRRAVTVELATSPDFNDESMVLTASANGGHYNVPANRLSAYTTYYARLRYTLNGVEALTPTVKFTTLAATCDAPTVRYPLDGGTLHCNERVGVNPTAGLKTYRIEISASNTFPSRNSYIKSYPISDGWQDANTGENIKILSKNLVDGNTYYLRVRGSYNTKDDLTNTAYSPTVTFKYSTETGSVSDITSDDQPTLTYADGKITVNRQGNTRLTVINALGATVTILHDGTLDAPRTFDVSTLPAGVYFVTLNGGDTLKFVK